MEEKMPKDFPFNEWTWNHFQRLKETLKKQPRIFREEKIRQIEEVQKETIELMSRPDET